MSWKDHLKGDSVSWLLEPENPGIRYLAMRYLQDSPFDEVDLQEAMDKAHKQGPIAVILDAMDREGFWEDPGPGYNPKYRSSVWSLILLAQLGASVKFDDRIAVACRYM